MKFPRFVKDARTTRALAILTTSILVAPAALAQSTWFSTNTGTINWSTPAAWDVLPVSGIDTALIFRGIDPNIYTANDDIAGAFLLNRLTLNSTATSAQTISATAGNSLQFVTNTALATPTITQIGTGSFAISAPFSATNALSLGGTGTGVTSLDGAVSGGGGFTFIGALWKLTNIANSFTGGLTMNTGAFVDLAPAGAAPQSVNIAPAATSIVGSNSAANVITLNGGTLKLTTSGAGTITLGASRPLTFGTNGGTFDITNTNSVSSTTQGGGMTGTTGGDLALTLNNAAGSPAVIKWNGGQLGLSNNLSTNGDWTLGTNALRISSITGTGPLRIELTNGALLRGSITTGAVDNTITVPLTIRGVIGGDPTSGPNGTNATGVSLTTGRMQYDSSRVNYNGGLTFEGAMALNPANRATAINGNITIASNGYVAFQGRGTGTNLNNTIVSPGSNTNPGQNVLWIGESSTTTLTVQGGGIAVFDGRNRIDQNNAHGVLLAGNAVVNAGGTLRIAQSISNYSNIPTTVASNFVTTQNEGDIILRGNVTGQGTTSAESLLNIFLPAPDATGTIANGVPTPLTATAPAAGTRPFAGLVAEATHNLVVNGAGFGGLQVLASPRPDRLFAEGQVVGGAATPDPTSNVTKLDAYLTATRLSLITGTGGYFSPGAASGTWNFPSGGEWAANVPVGLKIVDSNTTGADVTLNGSFQHNIHVAAGGTLDLGASPFTFGPASASAGLGTLSGKGVITAPGGLTINSGASVEPGQGDPGVLTGPSIIFTAGAKLSVEIGKTSVGTSVAGTDYDQLAASSVSLGGATLNASLLNAGVQVGDVFVVILNSGSNPISGTFTGIANGGTVTIGGRFFRLSYFDDSATAAQELSGSGNDVSLSAIPEPRTLGALLGGIGLLGTLGRFRRRCL